MRFLLGLVVVLLCACSRQGTDDAPAATRELSVTGELSPDAQRHPGQILHDDRLAGRRWQSPAAQAPQSVAWVQRDGKWIPVVKIVVAGSADRREITKLGPEGQVLERTVMTAP